MPGEKLKIKKCFFQPTWNKKRFTQAIALKIFTKETN